MLPGTGSRVGAWGPDLEMLLRRSIESGGNVKRARRRGWSSDESHRMQRIFWRSKHSKPCLSKEQQPNTLGLRQCTAAGMLKILPSNTEDK